MVRYGRASAPGPAVVPADPVVLLDAASTTGLAWASHGPQPAEGCASVALRTSVAAR